MSTVGPEQGRADITAWLELVELAADEDVVGWGRLLQDRPVTLEMLWLACRSTAYYMSLLADKRGLTLEDALLSARIEAMSLPDDESGADPCPT